MRVLIRRALVAACLLAPTLASADFKVWRPDVGQGELAIENVGDLGYDRNAARNGERSYTGEIEYGLTTWWQTELELEYERDPGTGQTTGFSQLTLENLFQFTERGEYWLDAGMFAEYGYSRRSGNPDEISLGPVLRKDVLGTSNSLNLFFQRDLGGLASGRPIFLYAWETRVDAWTWRIGRQIVAEPGVQIYGQPGPIGHFAHWSGQDERAGPQLFGKVFNLGPGTLEWNGGILFGLTPAVPRRTLRWQFEYEIHY
jgi:acetyltransferase-like isoleucine patch superfamily enzyme